MPQDDDCIEVDRFECENQSKPPIIEIRLNNEIEKIRSSGYKNMEASTSNRGFQRCLNFNNDRQKSFANGTLTDEEVKAKMAYLRREIVQEKYNKIALTRELQNWSNSITNRKDLQNSDNELLKQQINDAAQKFNLPPFVQDPKNLPLKEVNKNHGSHSHNKHISINLYSTVTSRKIMNRIAQFKVQMKRKFTSKEAREFDIETSKICGWLELNEDVIRGHIGDSIAQVILY